MTPGTEIATAHAATFDAERSILGPSGSLKILSGPQHATTEATYTTGWNFPRKEYDDLANGQKFRKLYVADVDGTRKAKLKAMTALQVDSVIHSIQSKDPQLQQSGGVPVYEFKVSPTGESV
jgi:hypothetical protein